MSPENFYSHPDPVTEKMLNNLRKNPNSYEKNNGIMYTLSLNGFKIATGTAKQLWEQIISTRPNLAEEWGDYQIVMAD